MAGGSQEANQHDKRKEVDMREYQSFVVVTDGGGGLSKRGGKFMIGLKTQHIT